MMRVEVSSIPLRPFSPAPLITCIKTVSAWSSDVWPSATADDPNLDDVLAKNLCRSCLAASSMDRLRDLAILGISTEPTLQGIPMLLQKSFTKTASDFESSFLIP